MDDTGPRIPLSEPHEGPAPTTPPGQPAAPGLVLVAGATGYIGRRLVAALVDAGHRVRCLARTPSRLDGEPWRSKVEVVAGDVTDPASLGPALHSVTHAYYLVHAIGADAAWSDQDRRSAANFADAAGAAGLRQVIYLGGLGDDDDALSEHLHSRHEVGQVLARGPVPVTELRAAVVIGSGSASFEMLRYLAETLPAMVAPRWVDSSVQPIAVADTLAYLVGVLDEPAAFARVVEIAGPDTMTYRDLMHTYAEVAGLRRRVIVPVPVLTPRLSSLWVGLVTPVPASLARPLVDSLVNDVVADTTEARRIVPFEPTPVRDAIAAALVSGPGGPDRHADHPAVSHPGDPDWSGGRVLTDVRRRSTTAPAGSVFATVTSLGGGRGWLAADRLWSARGALDRLVGGPGRRRRHPGEVHVGDEVDFWRVEVCDAPARYRLAAEMRLPGRAWLQWGIEPTADGCQVTQSAVFHPRGLAGLAYWYAIAPFHALVLAPMLDRVCAAAESYADAPAAD